MDSDYVLLLKTGQSELKAWASLPRTVRTEVLPLVELTRGRKIAKRRTEANDDADHRHAPGAYGFPKCVAIVQGILKEQGAAIVDLTREDSLSCYEIDQLALSDNGYGNWTAFLSSVTTPGSRLYPTVIVNPGEGDSPEKYTSDLSIQVDTLFQNYPGVCYRASILADAGFLYDLNILKDKINLEIENGKRFIVVLDHEFIRPSTGMVHAARTSGLVSSVFNIIPGANIVVMATSFPKSIEDIGNEDYDNFPIEERYLFEQVRNNIDSDNYRVTYGDYGSINPERMDMITRGWRPRIDFPTANRRTFYYREKRNIIAREDDRVIYDDYEGHYKSVAKKVVANEQYKPIPDSWGCDQIEQAAHGVVPGKSPSFWISVRMEIHVQQMCQNTRSFWIRPHHGVVYLTEHA